MKLTADTITDDQIRKLADDAEHALRFEGDRTKVLADTYAALNTDPWIQAKRPNERAAARARCAEILNARSTGSILQLCACAIDAVSPLASPAAPGWRPRNVARARCAEILNARKA